MNDYSGYALKLQNYLERHLIDQPEWKGAVEVARSWQRELRKEVHEVEDLEKLEKSAQSLDACGTAVEELQIMIRKWLKEIR